jgi:hypothetical protein
MKSQTLTIVNKSYMLWSVPPLQFRPISLVPLLPETGNDSLDSPVLKFTKLPTALGLCPHCSLFKSLPHSHTPFTWMTFVFNATQARLGHSVKQAHGYHQTSTYHNCKNNDEIGTGQLVSVSLIKLQKPHENRDDVGLILCLVHST